MKLLLDIGNTRIKWARLDDAGLSEQQAFALDGQDAGLMEQFARLPRPEQVCVANVAGPGIATRIQNLTRNLWQVNARFITSSAQASAHGRIIRNAYRDPAKLGVDRWLAILGAAQTHGAALVVSVGTAMTIDAVDANGQHLGGLIVPGPRLMVSSLLEHTSDIAGRAAVGRAMVGGSSDGYFANNTLACVEHGSRHACGALMAAAWRQLRQLQPETEATLWLTGGGAPDLLDELTLPVNLVPDLVLRGMATQL